MILEYLAVSLVNVGVFVVILAGAGILFVLASISKLFTRKGKEKNHG